MRLNNKAKLKKKHMNSAAVIAMMAALVVMTAFVCLCCGSVRIPFGKTMQILFDTIRGQSAEAVDKDAVILLTVRLPRVLCAALTGASLSVGGAAMQGLLKNPLADGSTLGVTSGATVGAVMAMALGLSVPALPYSTTVVMAVIFAFLSLALILSLAYWLDASLSTNTIILIGIIFSMFASSISTLIITFNQEKIRTITFWNLGSLQNSSYKNALLILIALVICSGIVMHLSDELNAFAIGEDNARNIGVDVRRTRLLVLATVSILTGVCVSVAGSIGFVGLVTPHMVRRLTGPNHRILLPVSMTAGAVFLMLADLAARTIMRPRELPIGVITSIVGSVVFVVIFYRSRER